MKKLQQLSILSSIKSSPRLAFSLIELSVVILIVGILVIGITKGKSIYNVARLFSAKSLTQKSPVISIDKLVMWLETTSDKSFITSEITATTPTISTWNDLNYLSAYLPNNATQATTASQPKYTTNAINGLPALRFDGSGDFLNFNGTSLANSNYTIFVVEQRRSTQDENYFINNTVGGTNLGLFLGFSSNTINFDHFASSLHSASLGKYSSPIPRIHAFRFSSTAGVGRNYYLNGILLSSNTALTTPLTSYNNANIAKYTLCYYNGDIGEIIMFNKALSGTERKDVEQYLGKKWGIKVG